MQNELLISVLQYQQFSFRYFHIKKKIEFLIRFTFLKNIKKCIIKRPPRKPSNISFRESTLESIKQSDFIFLANCSSLSGDLIETN